VRVFNRHGVDKDQRALAIERAEEERLAKDRDDELAILERNIFARLSEILLNKTAASGPKGMAADTKITQNVLDTVARHLWWQIGLRNDKAMAEIEALRKQYDESKQRLDKRFADKVDKLRRGDELAPGVMKMVKVFVAVKRKLQPGDKMAGRHGNKGVISRILPMEDMPYLDDGTPVDVVLNPLGVPSRMNVGQILETHLGWAALQLGRQIEGMIQKEWKGEALRSKLKKVFTEEHHQKFIDGLNDDGLRRFAQGVRQGVHLATPVFDGAKEVDIRAALALAELPLTGQTTLFDGKTGDPFDHDVTVGVMYMLKLHHLVDDKIHARSIGPYSLVTQQPLGGKAQFGGQRLGEMEVWAMEAYGAAYGLQEFLTVKSDDVIGRTRMYEAIVKGEQTLESGLPESFNVLLKELQSLCLNVELIEDPNAPRKQESTIELMAREVAAKAGAGAPPAAAASE
jgi:DNA-directed RNA polymerase subunit beta